MYIDFNIVFNLKTPIVAPIAVQCLLIGPGTTNGNRRRRTYDAPKEPSPSQEEEAEVSGKNNQVYLAAFVYQ